MTDDTLPEPAPQKARDQRKERKKISRGQHAQRLLSDELFNEAFDKVDQKIEEGWKALDSTPETRERAYLMHRLLVQLRTEFEVVIREGKSASKLLDLEEQTRARASSKPEPN